VYSTLVDESDGEGGLHEAGTGEEDLEDEFKAKKKSRKW